MVRDRLSTRAHRFSPAVYAVFARIDGKRTFDQIWRETVAEFGEHAPAQDQILQVASQLYAANLLRSDALVDEAELSRRAADERNALRAQTLRNPMFLRVPLVDPDRFLDATQHLVRPLCNWLGGLLWLLGVGWLVTEMATHWDALTADFVDRVLARDNLLGIYPPPWGRGSKDSPA